MANGDKQVIGTVEYQNVSRDMPRGLIWGLGTLVYSPEEEFAIAQSRKVS